MTGLVAAWLWAVTASAGDGPASGGDGLAPSLAAATWIAEGPVPADADALLVVEVWATWCGPCHATFPLLTRLQRDHGDRVRIAALSDEAPDVVRRTFQERAADMRFAVGVVDEDVTQAFLFGGFGGRGIPSVYVVRAGRVVWGGPPEELEAKLAELVSPAPLTPAGGPAPASGR